MDLSKRLKNSFKKYILFGMQTIVWVTLFYFLTGIFGWIFIKLFRQDIPLNEFILLITAALILIYTHETQKAKEEMIRQTELETRPIMCLYIRYIDGIDNRERKQSIKEKYSITYQLNGKIVPSPFYFALRNMGKGPAFNVEVENDNFKVEKYQTKFFAPEPKGDEHAIKIVKRPFNKIRKLEELEGEVFTINCQSVTGENYKYKYKIINIAERESEFLN